MKNTLCLALALALSVVLGAQESDNQKAELSSLKGEWKAVAMEAGGNSFPGDNVPDFRFIIEADGKSISKSPFGQYEALITVDPQKKPKTIDNLHQTGPQKGKKQYGIYKLEGDKWTVCMTPPNVSEDARPTTFDTAGTVNAVIVFKRHQEKKTP